MNVFCNFLFTWLMVVYTTVDAVNQEPCPTNCARCYEGQCGECFFGWHGSDCSLKCERCQVGGCERDTGICKQCLPGSYGDFCNISCPLNCRQNQNGKVYCERKTGKCLEGCKNTWWDLKCDQVCNSNCENQLCLQVDAECIGNCKVGWYGKTCDKKCSERCRENRCHVINGKCSLGCVDGYSGERCQLCSRCQEQKCNFDGVCIKGCVSGFSGSRCDRNCPKRCSNSHCVYHKDKDYDECIDGCVRGFYGVGCQGQCSSKCIDEKCDANGHCANGCVQGFYGTDCDKPCTVSCETCGQANNLCKTSLVSDVSDSENSAAAEQVKPWFCEAISKVAWISNSVLLLTSITCLATITVYYRVFSTSAVKREQTRKLLLTYIFPASQAVSGAGLIAFTTQCLNWDTGYVIGAICMCVVSLVGLFMNVSWIKYLQGVKQKLHDSVYAKQPGENINLTGEENRGQQCSITEQSHMNSCPSNTNDTEC